MKFRVKTLMLMLAVLVVSAAPAGFTQSQIASGDIKGAVTDASGGVVPRATVTVTNLETGIERSVATDSAGNFRFFLVPPGDYEVKVQLPSFSTYTRRPVQVRVGETVTVDAALQPASVQQEVLVQEVAPTVETEKTQQADTITEEQIENLPINERNFLNFTLLTPGVTDSTGIVTFSLPQANSSGLSFLGQSGRSNNVTIDGVDNNDDAVAGVRSTLSQEAVQEFQINRSNFSAEFGRAGGGLVNIVSKAGTNRVNGDVFAFFRDNSLDARNPFAFGPNGSNIDPPYSRQQAGFTLGAPIKKDKTFFFLSYEGLRQRESNFVTFMQNANFFSPTASQQKLIQGLLASPSPTLRGAGGLLNTYLTTTPQLFPNTIQTLQSNSGVFPYKNNNNTASLRLDHALSRSNQMFGRLTFTDIDTIGGNTGGLVAPSRGANFATQDYSGAFADSHFISSRTVNEFRFQFANRTYNVLPADAFGPEITINGVAELGRDFFLPSLRNEKRWQWLDNMTFVAGKHEIKFGGDFNYIPFTTTTAVFLGGRFIFGEGIPIGGAIDALLGPGNSTALAGGLAASGRADLIPNLSDSISALQAFNFGLPIVYQQGFGNPNASLTNKIFAGYVQDNFKATPKLNLNFGLRYDMEFQPPPVHRDRNNFGPRLGFAYSPNTKTVIRGGYGVYYSPLFEALAFISRALNGTQISQVFLPLTGLPGLTATSAQVWGLAQQLNVFGHRTLTASDIALLGIRPGITPPVLLRTASNIVNPYNQQFSFGIDHSVGGITLSANYIGNRGVKLIRSRNANLRQVGTNAFGPVFGPINPTILQDNVVETSGSSIYHGLALSATKRYSSHYQFQIAYTISKAIDDTTDFITDLQPANQLNLRGERGLSSFDQRHRLVLSGVMDPMFGITVAPIFTYASGHPFNLLLGFDANNDTNANTDRPPFAGRNTGIGPNFIDFDLRVAKEVRFHRDSKYRLEGIVEAFNLFNRVNFSGLNNVVGTTPLPTHHVEGNRNANPSQPLGFTSAFDPRQIQLGAKFKF
ncbi:MAG TPA: carboxypeptidase regulatory-like domain-containing protein [Terriglobia bacterium]|nr:carboxypeptidase regulatory-like domain-containing protein [Terriglobia bacterium]